MEVGAATQHASKTDVGGSAEVLTDTLQKLRRTMGVRIRARGRAITEPTCCWLTSNGIVIGFNVRPERNAEAVAEEEKVPHPAAHHIYNLTDEIKLAMTGCSRPYSKSIGSAEVRDTFRISKVGMVAGVSYRTGSQNAAANWLLRDNVVVHREGRPRAGLADDERGAQRMECGVTIENYGD
jgi:translation initiation factor IF-2